MCYVVAALLIADIALTYWAYRNGRRNGH
jgi:cbb3-type cytochrome oxidase subunit 3